MPIAKHVQHNTENVDPTRGLDIWGFVRWPQPRFGSLTGSVIDAALLFGSLTGSVIDEGERGSEALQAL